MQFPMYVNSRFVSKPLHALIVRAEIFCPGFPGSIVNASINASGECIETPKWLPGFNHLIRILLAYPLNAIIFNNLNSISGVFKHIGKPSYLHIILAFELLIKISDILSHPCRQLSLR